MDKDLKQKHFEISVRIFRHQTLVKNLMLKCAKYLDFDLKDIINRAENHDKSKLSDQEYLGSMLMGLKHEYNQELNEQEQKTIDETILIHYNNNSHHPEHYSNCNQMTNLDLLEMVCDWTARAMEKTPQTPSATNFASQNVGSKYNFEQAHINTVYQYIKIMDSINNAI